MSDNLERVVITKNRPAYKGKAEFWRSLFWGALIALSVTGMVLGWALHDNYVLQAEFKELRAFCERGITTEVK